MAGAQDCTRFTGNGEGLGELARHCLETQADARAMAGDISDQAVTAVNTKVVTAVVGGLLAGSGGGGGGGSGGGGGGGKGSRYVFRGDDDYKGGPIGLPLPDGIRAEDLVDKLRKHVHDKAGRKHGMFTSTSATEKRTEKFGRLHKAKLSDLEKLEADGRIILLRPEDVAEVVTQEAGAKAGREILRRMKDNDEVLIFGEVPHGVFKAGK